MRVIIDTNILISGLISKKGAPSKIINAVLQGQLVPVCSQMTLAELEDVLQRPHLQVYFQRSGISPVDSSMNANPRIRQTLSNLMKYSLNGIRHGQNEFD